MEKQNIPSEEWREVFDTFGRLHHGKETQITLFDPNTGSRPYGKDERLLGVIDEKHGQAEETVTVLLGGPGGGTSSHPFIRPTRVSISEWNDAYSAELVIESSDGRRMTVQVGPVQEVLPPDMITDGILLEQDHEPGC